jgi:hypothetical protein
MLLNSFKSSFKWENKIIYCHFPLNLCCVWMLGVQFITNFTIKTFSWKAEIFLKMSSQNVNNGNWTEWSAIWTEIKRVITKLHDREAGVRFVITSLISVQNCTTRSSISTLLYSFWNLKYFCKPETFLFAKDTPPVPPWML